MLSNKLILHYVNADKNSFLWAHKLAYIPFNNRRTENLTDWSSHSKPHYVFLCQLHAGMISRRFYSMDETLLCLTINSDLFSAFWNERFIVFQNGSGKSTWNGALKECFQHCIALLSCVQYCIVFLPSLYDNMYINYIMMLNSVVSLPLSLKINVEMSQYL